MRVTFFIHGSCARVFEQLSCWIRVYQPTVSPLFHHTRAKSVQCLSPDVDGPYGIEGSSQQPLWLCLVFMRGRSMRMYQGKTYGFSNSC